ncbi:MAG TPA: hypothetical protein VGF27_04495 [Pseudoduganella sp.]
MKLIAILLALASSSAMAAAPFSGTDYSGTYECKGDDNHEGQYEAIVTLKLDKAQSNGKYGAYQFKMEVPGYGEYPGHAAAYGANMAIHFANTDAATKDYGTGIAAFTKKAGKWTFKKYYFEPEFKGGNFGFENCRQK